MGRDEGCDGIDLAVGVEGLKVIILDKEADSVLVEALDDLQGFEGVTTKTADFKADHLVDVVGFHKVDKVHNLGPLLHPFRPADLVTEHRLHAPSNAAAIVGQFIATLSIMGVSIFTNS